MCSVFYISGRDQYVLCSVSVVGINVFCISGRDQCVLCSISVVGINAI